MSLPPREQGSTILFVVVGFVALLLVAFVVAGAALFLRRPATGGVARSSTALPIPPPPPPTLLPAPTPVPTVEAVLDAGTPDARTASKPQAAAGVASVSGSLPPDVIRKVVQRSMGRIRFCYEQGLATNPSLAGKVKIHFVIASDGTVATATDSDSTLGDPAVTACITRTFLSMVFPAPSGGIVTAVYPLTFVSAAP
jgi:hypothetical protein